MTPDRPAPPASLRQRRREQHSAANLISLVSAAFLLVVGGWYVLSYYQDVQLSSLVLSSHRGTVTTLAWSANGALLLSMDDGRSGDDSTRSTVIVWDAVSGEKLFELPTRGMFPEAAAMSPAGDRVACAMRDPAMDSVSVIGFFDARRGTLLREHRLRTGPVSRLLFSPGGKRLAAFSDAVLVWNPRTGALVDSLRVNEILYGFDLAFRSEGALPAAGMRGDTIVLRDVLRRTRRTIVIPGMAEAGRTAFSADGARLFAATGDSIFVYSTDTGARLSGIAHRGKGSGSLLVARDGSRLLLCESVSRIELVDAATAAVIASFDGGVTGGEGALRAVFAPDGKRFAVSNAFDGSVRVCDAATGRVTHTVRHRESMLESRDGDCMIAFPPRGAGLATARKDIRIWKLD